MGDSDFTIKDYVKDTNKKLDKFIDKVDEKLDSTDKRLDNLEQHKASMTSSITLLAWVFGAIVSIGGVAVAIIQLN